MIRNLKNNILVHWGNGDGSGVAVHDCVAYVTKKYFSWTPPPVFCTDLLLCLLSVKEMFTPLLRCCLYNVILDAFMNAFCDLMSISTYLWNMSEKVLFPHFNKSHLAAEEDGQGYNCFHIVRRCIRQSCGNDVFWKFISEIVEVFH